MTFMWYLLCNIHLLLNSLTLDFLSSLQRPLNSPLQYCQRFCKICLFHKISDLQIFFYGSTAPSGPRPHYRGFTITLRHSSGLVFSPTQISLPNNTQHSQGTNIHASGVIRTRNPSMRPAADPCLRQRGHWDQQLTDHAAVYCLITLRA